MSSAKAGDVTTMDLFGFSKTRKLLVAIHLDSSQLRTSEYRDVELTRWQNGQFSCSLICACVVFSIPEMT
tara:strand:- start:288 stop:497 length:210 start_codon:yes stop_codon:yes gene_type:complete